MRKSFSFAALCRVIMNLSGVATAFISIRIYNHYVSKETFGAILVGLQIVGYIPLMSGGFRMVVNQQMLAQRDETESKSLARFGQFLQTYFFLFILIVGLILLAAYGELPKTHATGIRLPVFLAIGVASALGFLAGGQLALLVAVGEQATSSLIQGGWGLATLLVLWISFAFGSGVWAFPFSNAAGALFTLLAARAALFATRNDLPLLIWRREGNFMSRLKVTWPAALECAYFQAMTVLQFTLDIILVGTLIGPGAAALYGIVARVTAISRQVLQSLSEAAWPRLAQEADPVRKAQLMRKVDRLNAWLVGAWYGAMVVTLLPLLNWLAPNWATPPLLAVLIVSRSFLTSVINPHAYGLLSAGRFRDLAFVCQQEVLTGLVLGLLLAKPLGAIGFGLGFFLATLTAGGWRMTKSYFKLAQDTHWVAELGAVYGRGITAGAASLALAAILWLELTSHFTTPGWSAVFVGAFAFAVPAGIVMLVWRSTGRIP